jgi:hypothetical protein
MPGNWWGGGGVGEGWYWRPALQRCRCSHARHRGAGLFLQSLRGVFQSLRQQGVARFTAVGIDAAALGLPTDRVAWSEVGIAALVMVLVPVTVRYRRPEPLSSGGSFLCGVSDGLVAGAAGVW